MKTTQYIDNLESCETSASGVERLIRVRAARRGRPVELLVHYEVLREKGGSCIQLFSIEDAH
jgi:hypothetical protein